MTYRGTAENRASKPETQITTEKQKIEGKVRVSLQA